MNALPFHCRILSLGTASHQIPASAVTSAPGIIGDRMPMYSLY
jgi:hypothetical protein